MGNFKKIFTMGLVGFFIGWALFGLFVLIYPPQGPIYGGPSAAQYMGYGGIIGFVMGALRGFWVTRDGGDSQE